jgi:hypothetical protein
MNVLGEGFPQEITEQVKQRQKIYGSGYAIGTSRTPEEIVYLNANTSWVKLVSSVNIVDQNLINTPSLKNIPGIKDYELARKFILFNGTEGQEYPYREGLSSTNTIFGEEAAYGIGGTDFGYRPMMGIQSANVRYENRGSIRRGSVKIKAFNKTQFDIIDLLYLRLGFSVLLEWGHSMYYDNKGNLITNSEPDNSLAIPFIVGKRTYPEFLRKIEENRRTSNGNYDAMFAKVSNFHWSFMPDGSYDITLDLVSIGDVVESFKINALYQGVNSGGSLVNTKPIEDLASPELITLFSKRHEVGLYFYSLQKANIDANTFAQAYGTNPTTVAGLAFTSPVSSTSTSTAGSGRSIVIPNSTTTDTFFSTYDGSQGDPFYYVRLGAFLEWLEKNYMYVATTVNSTTTKNNKSPILYFDYDVESNLMYIDPLQISVDPSVCVVRRDVIINDENGNPITVELGRANGIKASSGKLNPRTEPFESDLGIQYGKIMNIYLNMKYVLLKIESLKDKVTQKVVLIDFLKDILADISKNLGGVNDLDVFLEEETNTIKIIDKNPLPNINAVFDYLKNKKYTLYTDYALFYLYGYTATDTSVNAGFIKEFSFKTEITPAFSTMITVGATANSEVVGENSTALSRLNRGLKDRYKETISLPVGGSNFSGGIGSTLGPPNIFWQLLQTFGSAYVAYRDYIIDLGNFKFNEEQANTYRESLNSFITKKIQLEATVNTGSFKPLTGFIPFNLSLTTDGLSGMRINSRFNIDTKYLPSNYPETVKFLIKNLEHRIENNKWTTHIDSYCISQDSTHS